MFGNTTHMCGVAGGSVRCQYRPTVPAPEPQPLLETVIEHDPLLSQSSIWPSSNAGTVPGSVFFFFFFFVEFCRFCRFCTPEKVRLPRVAYAYPRSSALRRSSTFREHSTAEPALWAMTGANSCGRLPVAGLARIRERDGNGTHS